MNVLDAILAVFMGVAEWIGDAITGIIPIFYAADTGLTFIGVLSVASLAFAVVFLIINKVKDFIQFRG